VAANKMKKGRKYRGSKDPRLRHKEEEKGCGQPWRPGKGRLAEAQVDKKPFYDNEVRLGPAQEAQGKAG